MAVLEKIRVKFGLAASIIIAIGLLSFIIDPQEIASAFQGMSSKYDVGKIAGKKISYTEFQEDVQRFTTINQIVSGSSVQNSRQQAQIREAAWQDNVYKYLFVGNAKKAGINVGRYEMADLLTGDNVSPLIAGNGMFLDENGNFSVQAVRNLSVSAHSDENARIYWNYLQTAVYNQQLMGKYSALFTAASSANPLMLVKDIAENNIISDVDFVMSPLPFATDSTIVVSDKEIKDYYKSHKKFYKQPASRDIEYVVFEVKPSASDIAKTREEVADLYDEFASTSDVRRFLSKNVSDRSYDGHWYKQGELRSVAPALESFVWEGKGKVSDILTVSGNKFLIGRVLASAKVADSSYVRHILLQGSDAAKADSLLSVLNSKKESFANLAAIYSADRYNAADGEQGNMGWMTQNYMLPGFESVITAALRKPYVVKTQYGTHIVEVTKRTKALDKKQVAIFEREALPSSETFSSYYSKANNFASYAGKHIEGYRMAADTMGVYSHPVNNMLESADRLGSIEDTKEVTRWAFEAKAGKVSDIITINNNYFVIAALKAVHKEGFTPIAEVSQQIRQQLYNEKLAAKTATSTAQAVAGLEDLEAIAEKLGTTVSSKAAVAFTSMSNPGLDPKFIGAVSVAPEGKICGPVAGNNAVYVFKVTARDNGAFFTEDDARERDSQMSRYSTQMIIPVMMEDADVKDNRARFF